MTQDATDSSPRAAGTVVGNHGNGPGEPDSNFQVIDFTMPPREKPMTHPAVDPPICDQCQKAEMHFFDPSCPGCLDLLSNITTTVPEIFAILRQWTPQTQQNLEILIREILRRGAHVDDRDALTDMTMLHYASKAGAHGIGDPDEACRMANLLLSKGANVYIRSRWTNMAAIHYAVYFDVAPVVKILLKASKCVDVDSPCSEFDHGTPLHICATHLALDSAKVLIQNGGNSRAKDDLGRHPADCVPDPGAFEVDSDMAKLCTRLKKMLQDAEPPPPPSYLAGLDDAPIKDALRALGVKVGDRVVVGGVKTGILRYCGPTSFASHLWAGIELDEAAGKNDGSVSGISYFKCPPKYGIFAPLSKISKPGILVNHARPHSSPAARNFPKVNTSKVTARVDTGLGRRGTSLGTDGQEDLEIGDRALVAGQRRGIVRFHGQTDFAPGMWYGVEVDRPVGKNDGSVNGKRYFTCKPKHGVFAPPSRIQKLTEDLGSMESLESITGGQAEKHRRLSVGSASSQQSATSLPSKRSTAAVRNPGAVVQSPPLHCIQETVDPRPKSSSAALVRRSYSGSGADFKLAEGMSVFCNNELGVVRYIGPVDFSEGVWLGVELRTPKGKNDGSVQGKRYFSCRPGHGLVVRPSKVTVRGINGAKLLGDYHNTDKPELTQK